QEVFRGLHSDRTGPSEAGRGGSAIRHKRSGFRSNASMVIRESLHRVVMESTGSYWRPVFNILEGDLQVILANPEHVKALRGKKTDRKDCRWLAGLLQHGLVQASFIPPRKYRRDVCVACRTKACRKV